MPTKRLWTRLAALLALTALLSACGAAVTPKPAAAPTQEPAATPTPEPAARQASCDASAIRLLDHDPGVHGAIVADTLHMGGVTAPATCTEPTNESLLAGLSMPEDLTAQVQQSRYYLVVIRYPGGNRLYIVTRRGDGTSCVVDLNDACIAQVTDLPDGFDLEDLPDDVAPIIPAGRPVRPPPAPSEPATPSEPAAPPAGAPRAAWFPAPSDGATNVDVASDGSLMVLWEPGESGGRGGATTPSFDVYWGTAENLAADAELGSPIRTTTSTVDIQRLRFDTAYYWRVDANNAAGTTRGNVWSFTTRPASAPPPAYDPLRGVASASNPRPRDGATNVSLNISPATDGTTYRWFHLGWDAVPGAHGYYVYVGTSQDLASDNTRSFSAPYHGKTFYYEDADFSHGTTYYWRVDTQIEPGAEARIAQGNVWSFTMKAAPAPPPAEEPPAEEPPPGVATNPQPRDGATGVTVG